MPSWVTAIASFGLLFGGFLVFRWLTGYPIWTGPDTWETTASAKGALVLSMIIAWGVAASRYDSRATARDLQRLGLFDADVDLRRDELRAHEAPVAELRRSRWAGAAGVAFFAAVTEIRTAFEGLSPLWEWVHLHSETYIHWMVVLLFWLIGRGAYSAIRGSQLVSETIEEQLEIDLLNLRPLHVLGRMALRGALFWIIGMSLASLLFLDPGISAESTVQLAVYLAAVTGLATLALLLPVRGVHRRLQALKRAELERIDAAIAGDAAALDATRIAERGEVSLADLVAYRGLIESVREWPFEAHAVPRFALFLLIPLLSWLGGALVERVVDAALE